MKIKIEWQRPLLLAKNRQIRYADEDLNVVDNLPGVYFFSRKYGDWYEPFYIGETLNLQGRLRSHLNSAKIFSALRGIVDGEDNRIARGARYFHFGYLRTKRGQVAKTCLDIVQEFMIELAIAQEIPLLNIQKTVIRTHDVTFSGRAVTRSIFKKHNEVIRKKTERRKRRRRR